MFKIKFQNHCNIALISTVLCLILAGLAVWWPSPFYPDELAFRTGSTRFIQDGYVRWGLYPFCTNTSQQVPLLFIPSAWILSALEILLYPHQLRLIALAAVFFTCMMVALLALSKKNLYPVALLSLVTIGVSGSGLVLARGEHIIILAIYFCLLAVYLGENAPRTLRLLVFFALVFTVITCIFIHPQGILFIPLIGCAATSIINLKLKSKKIVIAIWACLFMLLLYGFNYHQLTCEYYPNLIDQFKLMVFSVDKLQTIHLLDFIVHKFTKYIEVFFYLKQYQVFYIPGIKPNAGFVVLNTFIAAIVVCLLILNVTLTIIRSYCLIRNAIQESSPEHKKINLIPIVLSYIAIFLLFYDFMQYFYRTFFLHLIIIISNTLYLISDKTLKFKFWLPLWLVCLGVSAASTLSNYKHFFHRLPLWDAIATTPKSAVAHPEYEDIYSVALSCKIDISKGRLITDAYTYEVVKSSKLLVDVYYARLIANVSQQSVFQIMRGLQIDHVLASCKGMKDSDVGWPPDVKKNNICCSALK